MKLIDVLQESLSDLQDFLAPGNTLEIVPVVGATSQIISVKGAGKNKRVHLLSDTANFEVNNLEDYCFSALIIGHELAHCLCEHNKHKDIGKTDRLLIEAFADYLGARISLTIMTFGKSSSSSILRIGPRYVFGSDRSYIEWLGRVELRRCIGRALKRIHDGIYINGAGRQDYIPPIDRVLTVIAGAMSFYARYYNRVQEYDAFLLFNEFYVKPGFDEITSERELPNLHRTSEIHQQIQGSSLRIGAEFKDEYKKYLETNFQYSIQQMERRAMFFKSSYEGWSLNSDKRLTKMVDESLFSLRG